ncbi:MAG TPA: DeoR/GlpR family DNA-binding transcription regulator [Kaistia sp.]|nr:DeoR/GlpR family DNA-binding transcription regulator [Kaistia sp.]
MHPDDLPSYDPAVGFGRMPAGARQSLILDVVEMDGFVSVSQIASNLNVSEMTIRRDLVVLEERGLLARTHGGAVSAATSPREVFDLEEPAFKRRRHRNAREKTAIAHAAAGLIGPSETIGLDVGTSTLTLAEAIIERTDLRVFTNSLRAAMVLSASKSPVYVLGGEVRNPEQSVVGSRAVGELANYNLDRVFIGVSGLIEAGFFDYSVEDSEVKRAFIARADQIVILCDSSKFDHRSLARVCDIAGADVLVTDAPPPNHLARALEAAEVEVIVASPVAERIAG